MEIGQKPSGSYCYTKIVRKINYDCFTYKLENWSYFIVTNLSKAPPLLNANLTHRNLYKTRIR